MGVVVGCNVSDVMLLSATQPWWYLRWTQLCYNLSRCPILCIGMNIDLFQSSGQVILIQISCHMFCTISIPHDLSFPWQCFAPNDLCVFSFHNAELTCSLNTGGSSSGYSSCLRFSGAVGLILIFHLFSDLCLMFHPFPEPNLLVYLEQKLRRRLWVWWSLRLFHPPV